MSVMSDLIFAIPNIVTQKDPSESIGAASVIYEGFYKPLESWVVTDDEPTISDISCYSHMIVRCYSYSGFDMLRQYIEDLLFFNILHKISSLTSDKYSDILESIKLKWTSKYSFLEIDAYHTFASIEAE